MDYIKFFGLNDAYQIISLKNQAELQSAAWNEWWLYNTKEQESNPLNRIISLAFALICCYEFSWQSGQHPLSWRKCLYLQMFCRLILQCQKQKKGAVEGRMAWVMRNCLSQNPWWLNGMLSCSVLKLSYCLSAGRQGSPSFVFCTLWIQTPGSESYNFALTHRHSKAF